MTSTNMWTWMSGSNMGDQAGIYGTKVYPKPPMCPERGWKCLLDRQSGNLWLFGGDGTPAILRPGVAVHE